MTGTPPKESRFYADDETPLRLCASASELLEPVLALQFADTTPILEPPFQHKHKERNKSGRPKPSLRSLRPRIKNRRDGIVPGTGQPYPAPEVVRTAIAHRKPHGEERYEREEPLRALPAWGRLSRCGRPGFRRVHGVV